MTRCRRRGNRGLGQHRMAAKQQLIGIAVPQGLAGSIS